jgi:hypothetical protein
VNCCELCSNVRQHTDNPTRRWYLFLTGSGDVPTFGGDEDKFLQAAADCIDIARGTQDEQTRVALIVLAQQWLDLAQNGSDDGALVGALQAFSDWQMRKKTMQ